MQLKDSHNYLHRPVEFSTPELVFWIGDQIFCFEQYLQYTDHGFHIGVYMYMNTYFFNLPTYLQDSASSRSNTASNFKRPFTDAPYNTTPQTKAGKHCKMLGNEIDHASITEHLWISLLWRNFHICWETTNTILFALCYSLYVGSFSYTYFCRKQHGDELKWRNFVDACVWYPVRRSCVFLKSMYLTKHANMQLAAWSPSPRINEDS